MGDGIKMCYISCLHGHNFDKVDNECTHSYVLLFLLLHIKG